MRTTAQKYLFALLAIASLSACSGDNNDESDKKGTLEITIYGEDFIEKKSNLDDKWTVTYDKYEVTLKDIHQGETKFTEDGKTYTFNLKKDTNEKGTLVVSKKVPIGEYSPSFTIESVKMKGEAVNKDNTKRLTFEWNLTGESFTFSECDASTKVEADRTSQFQITIHSDHIFFNNLQSHEPETTFKGYALADANGNNIITEDELKKASIPGDYDTGSESGVENMWDLLKKQIATVGHANGENHCKIERKQTP